VGGKIAGAAAISIEVARAELAGCLGARFAEIEQAALTRIQAISDPALIADAEYADGLRTALGAAIEYGIATIASGENRTPPIPAVLLTQARVAARSGVSLDTVLRRYFAGYTLLSDFLIEEVGRAELLEGQGLKRLLRSLSALFDHLLTAVSEEHAREAGAKPLSAEQRRAELVRRLLAGELIDTRELSYDVEAEHLAAIAAGSGAEAALRTLADALDRCLLLAPGGEGTVWAWFGGRRPLAAPIVDAALERSRPDGVLLALGEPARGLAGWRLTHRQAKAALSIAQRNDRSPVRYADVALLAAILQDDVLCTSLRKIYLAPLQRERDGGKTLFETLRAYFGAARNGASAAAALGVSRQTVTNRLRAVETQTGRSLDSCALELEVALRLERFNHPVPTGRATLPMHLTMSRSRCTPSTYR
jgi:PucR C-terminal helix-turn-helix domain/GGDEF-like domain